MNVIYESELYHYGIKGQKWGVRRFETLKGRLTSAGKKRYDKRTDQKDSSKKVKKAAIIAGASLSVIGGYALYKNRDKIKALSSKGKAKINPDIFNKTTTKHPLDGIDDALNNIAGFKKPGTISGVQKPLHMESFGPNAKKVKITPEEMAKRRKESKEFIKKEKEHYKEQAKQRLKEEMKEAEIRQAYKNHINAHNGDAEAYAFYNMPYEKFKKNYKK